VIYLIRTQIDSIFCFMSSNRKNKEQNLGYFYGIEKLENNKDCFDCGTMDIEDLSQDKIKNEQICKIHQIPLCCCGQSKVYPICDGTHEIFNEETNSNIQPIILKIKEETKDENKEEQKKIKRKLVNSGEIRRSIGNYGELISPTIVEETIDSNEKTPKSKKEITKIVNRKSITAIYTAEEVAKHCTKEDCWMIIRGNVYDVSSYFDYHPGGHQSLLNFAGKDGTENVEYHSSKMMYLLNNYFYIGKLQKESGDSSCIIS